MTSLPGAPSVPSSSGTTTAGSPGNLTSAQVAERSLHSTFGIVIKLHHTANLDDHELMDLEDMERAKRLYYQITNLVNDTLPKTPEEEEESKDRKGKGKGARTKRKKPVVLDDGFQRNDGERTVTGFAVGKEGAYLKIITCAHGIGETFGRAYHGISPEDINSMYSIEVQCSHAEIRVLNQLGNRSIEKEERYRTAALCVAIDPKKDLMLLQVRNDALMSGEEITDGQAVGVRCLEEHPIIHVMTEDLPPESLERCILQGWPPHRVSSLSEGSLSFKKRPYDALTQDNPKEYAMKLAEFTNLAAESGCSGGAVVSLDRMLCMGVYHGVAADGKKGYAVCTSDVREFLQGRI